MSDSLHDNFVEQFQLFYVHYFLYLHLQETCHYNVRLLALIL
jgi:hypothetical protein